MGFYYRVLLIKIFLINVFLVFIVDCSLIIFLFENCGNNYIVNCLVFVKYF